MLVVCHPLLQLREVCLPPLHQTCHAYQTERGVVVRIHLGVDYHPTGLAKRKGRRGEYGRGGMKKEKEEGGGRRREEERREGRRRKMKWKEGEEGGGGGGKKREEREWKEGKRRKKGGRGLKEQM